MDQTCNIKIDDRAVRQMLAKLARKTRSLRPLMQQIGERLIRSTDDRFRDEQDPEGNPWQALAPATLRAKARRKKTGLKILAEGGNLRGNINYRAAADSVTIGSPEPYARIHQFGGKAGRNQAATIPARPFLGIGPEDEKEILALLHDFLHVA